MDYGSDVICVPRCASKGIQELGVVCQPSFGSGLLRAELGGTEAAKRASQRRQAIWKISGAGLVVDGLQQQI